MMHALIDTSMLPDSPLYELSLFGIDYLGFTHAVIDSFGHINIQFVIFFKGYEFLASIGLNNN